MAKCLSLSMLSALQIILALKPVTGFVSNKVRALLAYLAVESSQARPREVLAGLLWPEFPDLSVLNTLLFSLTNPRKVLGDQEAQPPYLLPQKSKVQFNIASNHRLDVLDFSNSVETGDIERLKQAVTWCRGPFWENFAIAESDAFEDWLRLKREQLHRLIIKAVGYLVEHYAACADFDRTKRYAWRARELEPWLEEGHRQLMRALALGGNRSAALAQYEAGHRLLANGLGVELPAETTALYQEIASETLPGPHPVPAFLDPTTRAAQVEQPFSLFGRLSLPNWRDFSAPQPPEAGWWLLSPENRAV